MVVDTVEQKEINQEELRKALTAMHHGLLSMQERLDDHEKVIEKLMMVLDNFTAGQTNGFRQPKKLN